MRRVNISNDVQSREQIATATTQTPVDVSATVVEPINTNEDGKTEEIQGGEDNPIPETEPDTTPKRGRKTTGNAEKI